MVLNFHETKIRTFFCVALSIIIVLSGEIFFKRKKKIEPRISEILFQNVSLYGISLSSKIECAMLRGHNLILSKTI